MPACAVAYALTRADAYAPAHEHFEHLIAQLHAPEVHQMTHSELEALAPGVDPATLDLSVVGNTLSITGEKRRVAGDVKPEAFHRSERATGKFVRHLQLPVEVDENRVHADYKDGLLIVTLPKAEKAKPKQIAVQVG